MLNTGSVGQLGKLYDFLILSLSNLGLDLKEVTVSQCLLLIMLGNFEVRHLLDKMLISWSTRASRVKKDDSQSKNVDLK